jgi:hypothetical protein
MRARAPLSVAHSAREQRIERAWERIAAAANSRNDRQP